MQEQPPEAEPEAERSDPRDQQDALCRQVFGTYLSLREDRRDEIDEVLSELAEERKLSELDSKIRERLYGPPMTYGAIADAVGRHPRFVVEAHGRIVDSVRERMIARAHESDADPRQYWLVLPEEKTDLTLVPPTVPERSAEEPVSDPERFLDLTKRIKELGASETSLGWKFSILDNGIVVGNERPDAEHQRYEVRSDGIIRKFVFSSLDPELSKEGKPLDDQERHILIGSLESIVTRANQEAKFRGS